MTRCDWCDGGVPSELAIVIAAVAAADREGWAYADRVLGKLRLLGFNVSHQRLAAAMVRMTKVDAPWLERRCSPFSEKLWQYRVTQWGDNDVNNRLNRIRLDRLR